MVAATVRQGVRGNKRARASRIAAIGTSAKDNDQV
jgi:hypothetical protein